MRLKCVRVGCVPGRMCELVSVSVCSISVYVHGHKHMVEVRHKGVCKVGALTFLSACVVMFKAMECECKQFAVS